MFTESCYIRKNTSELRDRLKKLGKEVCVCCTFADNIWLCSDSKYVRGIGGFDGVEPYTQEGALKRFVEENPKDEATEEEETAVFLPLSLLSEKITPARFPDPKANEIGSFETARMLFDASRLSFRNAAGPFRCMGKLSFRPRSYQLVPLVMALKQDIVRLLIADDVGIGKTIEALIILKELIERGEVKKFAIICPPHLCEQWQQEIKDK